MPENEELFSRLQNKMKLFLSNGFVQLKNAVMDNSIPVNMVDEVVHPPNNPRNNDVIPDEDMVHHVHDGAWNANDNDNEDEEEEDVVFNANVEHDNDVIVDNVPSVVEDRVPSVVEERGHPVDNGLINQNAENGRPVVANASQRVAGDVQQVALPGNIGINEADTQVDRRQPDENNAIVVAVPSVERVYKNCFVMNQKEANLRIRADTFVNCKSSRKKNGTNAAVGLLALAGFELCVTDATNSFNGKQSFGTMEPKYIKRNYNRLLKNRGLKLVAKETNWETVFPTMNDNAIIVVIFLVKPIFGDYVQNRVAIYDSGSKVLIPFNTKGTALFIGNRVRAAASAPDPTGKYLKITKTLCRHLYTRVSKIKLMAVYQLYERK